VIRAVRWNRAVKNSRNEVAPLDRKPGHAKNARPRLNFCNVLHVPPWGSKAMTADNFQSWNSLLSCRPSQERLIRQELIPVSVASNEGYNSHSKWDADHSQCVKRSKQCGILRTQWYLETVLKVSLWLHDLILKFCRGFQKRFRRRTTFYCHRLITSDFTNGRNCGIASRRQTTDFTPGQDTPLIEIWRVTTRPHCHWTTNNSWLTGRLCLFKTRG
jgi:hypothetical protein